MATAVAAHGAGAWALLKAEPPPDPVVAEAAPVMVELLVSAPVMQAAAPPPPARPVPAPPQPPRPAPRTPRAAPALVATEATTPAAPSFVSAVPRPDVPEGTARPSQLPSDAAAPAATPAPPSPPAAPVAAPAAPSAPPAPPTAPKTLASGAVRYLEPPAPVYPSASRRFGERGRVVVRVLIDERGLPAQLLLQASSGHRRLDDAALAALRAARFVAHTEDGVTRRVWALVPIDFELES